MGHPGTRKSLTKFTGKNSEWRLFPVWGKIYINFPLFSCCHHQYHQYRIANAIFKMTFSHLNMSANERRRQEQNTALKRFQVGEQLIIPESDKCQFNLTFNATYDLESEREFAKCLKIQKSPRLIIIELHARKVALRQNILTLQRFNAMDQWSSRVKEVRNWN